MKEAKEAYGVLLSTFWTGRTGRQIQERSKDAVILALFLSANEFANMIGLYELSLPKIERSLPALKGRAVLKRAFEILRECGFAYYDQTTEFVWVREMARVRLQLHGAPMDGNDKRRLGAVKLYARLPLNPFLGPFYDRYVTELSIPARRHGGDLAFDVTRQAPSQAPSEAPSQAPSQGAYLTPSITSGVPGTSGTRDQGSDGSGTSDQENRYQVTERAAAAPPRAHSSATTTDPSAHVEVITTLIRKELLPLGLPEDDLMEATKERCARLRIPYTSATVRKALDSALVRSRL